MKRKQRIGLITSFTLLATLIIIGSTSFSSKQVSEVLASEDLYYETGFEKAEGFTGSYVYNEDKLGVGPVNYQWDFRQGTVSAAANFNPILGGQAAAMRPYNSGNRTPYFETTFTIPYLTKVKFIGKTEHERTKLSVSYSYDRIDWYGVTTYGFPTENNLTDYTFIASENGLTNPAYVRFQITENTGDGKGLGVDNIRFYQNVPNYVYEFNESVDRGDHLLGGLSWEVVLRRYINEVDEDISVGFDSVLGVQYGTEIAPLTEVRYTSDFFTNDGNSYLERFQIEVRAANSEMEVKFIDYTNKEYILEESVVLNDSSNYYTFNLLDYEELNTQVGRLQLTFKGMSEAMYIKSFKAWCSLDDSDLYDALVFANKLEKYKTCTSEAIDATNDLTTEYNALNSNSKAYLNDIKIRDFGSDAYSVIIGRDISVSAAFKWSYINYQASIIEQDSFHSRSSEHLILFVIIVSIIGLSTLAGYYFIRKRPKEEIN